MAVSEFVLVSGGVERGGESWPLEEAPDGFVASGAGLPLPFGPATFGGLSCCIWARRGDLGGAAGYGLKGSRLSPCGLLMKLRGRELRFMA